MSKLAWQAILVFFKLYLPFNSLIGINIEVRWRGGGGEGRQYHISSFFLNVAAFLATVGAWKNY